MPKFETQRRVSHSAQNMFDLVADVEQYPQFVPLCEQLRTTSRRERDGQVLLHADMTVGYKAVRETFTSKVLLRPDDLRIETSYVDGPFRYMENVWRFEPVGDHESIVHFFIDYEFRSRLLSGLMGSMFDRAFRKFSGAFEARADEIYGRGDRVQSA